MPPTLWPGRAVTVPDGRRGRVSRVMDDQVVVLLPFGAGTGELAEAFAPADVTPIEE